TALSPTVLISDLNLLGSEIILDGITYVSGTQINQEGSHLLLATASDIAGNSSSASVRFEQDFTPPEITVNFPANGSQTSQLSSPLTGSTEQNSTVFLSTGSYSANVQADQDGLFAFSDIPLALGANIIELYAIDLATNQGQQIQWSITVVEQNNLSGTLDVPVSLGIGTDLPVNYQINNLSASAIVQLPIEVQLFNDTNNQLIDSRSLLIDLAANASFNQLETFLTADLAVNNYQIILRAEIDGNWQQLDAEIISMLDQTAPAINPISPTNGQISAADIVFSAEITDESSTVQSAEYQLDSSGSWLNLPLANNDIYSSSVTLTHGAHTVAYRATDTYGNQTTSQDIAFVIDTQAPIITINQPINGLITNQSITIDYVISDDSPYTESATLNGQNSNNGATVSADGNHQLIIIATDQVLNQSEQSVQFIIDTIPPDVTITFPTDGQELLSSQTDVSGQTEALAQLNLIIAGNSFNTQADDSGLYTFSQIPLQIGSNTIEVIATDQAGNSSQPASVSVSVLSEDIAGQITTAPSHEQGQAILLNYQISNQNALNITGMPIEVRLIDIDTLQVLQSHQNNIDIAGDASYNQTINFNSNDLQIKPYRLELFATLNGKTSLLTQTTINVVDTTAPDLLIISPQNGDVTSQQQINVTGSSEENADIYLSLNGQNYQTQTNNSIDFIFSQMPLLVGENQLSIYAEDQQNNQSQTQTLIVHRIDGSQLQGIIQGVEPVYLMGETLNFNYVISASNTTLLSNVSIQMEIINTSNQNIQHQQTELIDLAPDGSVQIDATIDSNNWPEANYLIQLSAQLQSQQSAVLLDAVSFELQNDELTIVILEPETGQQIIGNNTFVRGRSLPNIQITVSNQNWIDSQTAQAWTQDTVTDNNGYFQISQLPLQIGKNVIIATATQNSQQASASITVFAVSAIIPVSDRAGWLILSLLMLLFATYHLKTLENRKRRAA
ncbi:MAG: Ig-like domain-containing protein, partial [Candidatus Marinimicrobia bacterium]|nr:Ig-like domain-containing protein [Candidatus Neomarinimicrobiota bacterium]